VEEVRGKREREREKERPKRKRRKKLLSLFGALSDDDAHRVLASARQARVATSL
jgi:hypothetical protein